MPAFVPSKFFNGLRLSVSSPSEDAELERDFRAVCERRSQNGRLIETSFPESQSMQRNRDNEVGFCIRIIVVHDISEPAAEYFEDSVESTIFTEM